MTAVVGPDAPALAVAAVTAVTAETAAGAVAAGITGTGRTDEQLVVANHNGPRQAVLSGTTAAVSRAEELIRAEGGRTRRLKVAGAFHSVLMEPAARRLTAALDRVVWRRPKAWVIPNVTGQPTRDPGLLAALLRRHLLSPVRWTDTMQALSADGRRPSR